LFCHRFLYVMSCTLLVDLCCELRWPFMSTMASIVTFSFAI
jgi:hypothetical protein